MTGALNESELCKMVRTFICWASFPNPTHQKVLESADRLLAVGAFVSGPTRSIFNRYRTWYRGIQLPFSNTRSVAELVIAHCISLLRRVPEKAKPRIKANG